ncbi:DUF2141 domain-containing protein [Mesonia aestuariivivens]|uniref:DUF2141 domain-containing protein n=1 Tax=Mesonia aestuariivivens TaxID=2796128 RepID=A0ABS6VY57_9FLAO|nr:DUF2141 domain-containing protein [Mesonia aestuariivivens]MBW2960515.1 DUF2141 domain-containing protein [Mesonia aestuariivivens]
MKAILICLMIALGEFVIAQETTNLTIKVENISNDEGQLMVGLYTENNFLTKKPPYSQQVKIKNGKATIIFNDVPVGEYGICSFHDANANQKMDFQANGMPVEDYGISNNPILYGPPTWGDAKFELTEGNQEITIRF